MVRRKCYSVYSLQHLAGFVWVARFSELTTFNSVGLCGRWYPDGRFPGSLAVRLAAPTKFILFVFGLLICLLFSRS